MSSPIGWTSTLTPIDAADRIRSAIAAAPDRSVCVTTHMKADGDAVGSSLAIARSVEAAGGAAVVVHQSPFPTMFRSICDGTTLLMDVDGGFEDPAAQEAAMTVVIDTGSWNQLAGAAEYLRARADRVLIIDHHKSGDPDITDQRLIEPGEPAACAIAAKVATSLLNLRSPAELPVQIATPIYLGLATDTGWFRHPSVTPSTMHLAGDLLEAGVDHNRLYLSTEQSDPPERLWLVRAAMNSLKLHAGGRVATMGITQHDFAESGATPEHTGGLIDLPKTVVEVEVSILAYPVDTDAGPFVKVSLRSKAGGADVDVNQVAGSFGGGGHKHAAGCKISLPLDEAIEAVVERVQEELA